VGPTVVDSRIRNMDAGILMLWTEYEIKATKHNSSLE